MEHKAYKEKLSQTLRKAAEASNLLRKTDEAPSRHNKALAEIMATAPAKAHRLLGVINEASKSAIYFLKQRDIKEAEAHFSDMISQWKEACDHYESLVDNRDIIKEQYNDAGQEVMETIMVFLTWPAIEGDFNVALNNLARMPIPGNEDNEWNIYLTHQQWLAGLLDTPSELSKMSQEKLLDGDLNDYEEAYSRMGMVSMAIYNLLEKFESQNTRMLDCSHRRGQGFKPKLQRLKNFISERINAVLINIRIQNSK